MTKITEMLWVGNRDEANNIQALRNEKIDAILNCTLTSSNTCDTEEFLLAKIGLEDSIDGKVNYLCAYYSAVFQLINLLKLGKKVFVHCGMGHSRSVSVIIMYLHVTDPEKRSWEYWRGIIRELRPEIDAYQPRIPHRDAFELMDFDFIRAILNESCQLTTPTK